MQDSGTIGRFKIVRRIGSGGMGVVFLARDPLLDRPVAIKLLRADEAEVIPELMERFHREAQAAGRLAHPNIVTIFDVGEHQGQPFIAMEYVDGDTLAQLIHARPPWPLARKLEIVEAICAGLAHAHRAGLVHRDVKPANVLIGRHGEVKVLDFGIARFPMSGATMMGALLGTPRYMAPEQLNGAVVDSRADIFAVGVILFELVTWRRPFEAESISAVMLRILNEAPPAVSTLEPEASPELDAIAAKALQKRPEDRYQSLESMGRDLALLRRSLRPAHGETAVASGELEPRVPSGGAPSPMTPPSDGRRDPPERRVAETVQRVQAAFDSGDFDTAQRLLDEVASLDPDDLSVRAAYSALERARRAQQREQALAVRRESSRDEATATPPDDSNGPRMAAARRPWPRAETPALPPESSDVAAIDAADLTVMLGPSPAPSPAPLPADLLDRTMVLTRPTAPRTYPDLAEARLVVTDSPDPRRVGRSFALSGDSVIIGRSDGWLDIADVSWSRKHAEICCTESGFMIRDFGSQNGTRVNGYRIGDVPQPILFGARIDIGSTTLTFAHTHEMRVPELAGFVIDGRYVLETRLREGAKATVYVARDTRLSARVALKLLSPELARFPGYRSRFQREAELARQLHHPHICQVLDYGQTELRVGDTAMLTYYLCLELMEGGNLADRLERRDRFDWRLVAKWVEHLAGALHLAHRRGLVHRDLKPSAVVFDADDNPYVTDFAIAQQGADDQARVVGTPSYMAPELWEGTAPTPAVDQFGLAALSYYLITGSRPFEGQEHPEIRRRNFLQGPLPAHVEAEHNGRSGLLRGVSAVLAKGLAALPEDRFESITAFAGALSASLVRPQRPTDAAQLFFSYQRESTSGWVNYFADRMRAAGLTVFVDTHNRDSGGRFPEQTARTIEDCSVFVCFLGEKTLESRWVRDEVDLAHRYGKAMIPVFQEGYVRPDGPSQSRGVEQLLTSQGIHLHDRQNLNPEQSAIDLVSLARRTLEESRNG